MSAKAILDRVLLRRRQRPTGQFGQANDATVANGAVACTHTWLQFLAWLWTGKWYTLDQVSAMAGYPRNAGRGMRPAEVATFIRRAKLPYVIRWGLTAAQILTYSNRGPVMVAHIYREWPEWRGYRYGGQTADGRPNGYARPYGKAGKTQLTGFEDGRHMGGILGYLGSSEVYVMDPNHGSPSRPEKVAYDVISTAQLSRIIKSFSPTYAVIPTRSLPL